MRLGLGLKIPDVTVAQAGEGGGLVLPYTFDPSVLGDGILPAPWVGNTFAISGGVVVNVPVLGSELLTDTGLEVNYTSGLCDSLVKDGSPTLAQSADVHGGSKAQEFTGVAVNNTVRQFKTPVAQRWYQGSVWGKRAAGAAGNVRHSIYQSGAWMSYGDAIKDASYTQKFSLCYTKDTGNFFIYPAKEDASGPFDTVIVDDMSLKPYTTSELFATVESGITDVIIKVRLAQAKRALAIGCVARLDSITNPQNYIIAFVQTQPNAATTWIYASLLEIVNGVLAAKINNTYVGSSLSATKDFELRLSGSTAGIYYDGVQKGTNQTVSVLTGTKHGIFGAGGAGNSCNRFFLAGQLIEMLVGFAGSSLTANNTTGYRPKTMDGLRTDYPQYDFIFESNAISGHGTFSNLMRFSDLSGNELIISDLAGLDEEAELEALIRRAWGGDQRIILVVTPTWTDYTDDEEVNMPLNETLITNAMALMDTYGVPYVDLWAAIQVHVGGGGHISDWYADWVHPSDEGYTQIEVLLDDNLPTGGAVGELPARQYANTEDFENAPTHLDGTDYDSKTGTWAEDGAQVSSSTEGSTIVYSGTFRWFGCYRIDGGTNDVEIDIDGGGYVSTPFKQYPQDTGSQAAHTITIRIPAGGNCTIDEFWAI